MEEVRSFIHNGVSFFFSSLIPCVSSFLALLYHFSLNFLYVLSLKGEREILGLDPRHVKLFSYGVSNIWTRPPHIVP